MKVPYHALKRPRKSSRQHGGMASDCLSTQSYFTCVLCVNSEFSSAF